MAAYFLFDNVEILDAAALARYAERAAPLVAESPAHRPSRRCATAPCEIPPCSSRPARPLLLRDAVPATVRASMPAFSPHWLQERQVAPPPGALEGRDWRGHSFREVRWQGELARLLVDPLFRGRGVAHGNGSPVILIPGFLAGDWSLGVLYRWLRRIGHVPERSGISFNADCPDRAVRRLESRVARSADRTGARVALVGHSRGGHFAKALAHRRPDLVGSVVSLGAGLDALYDVSVPMQRTSRIVAALHARTTDRRQRRGCMSMACRCQFTRDYWGEFPADVALTSIYSKSDGVVWWESCIVPYAACVEVTGSHVGLAVNRHAYRAVAEALAAHDDGRGSPAASGGRRSPGVP